MNTNPELFKDYSETVDLDKNKIRELLIQLDVQRDELAGALARSVFAKFTGKNILVKYKNKKIVIIGRSTKFYVYDPDSIYVNPDIYTFQDVINSVLQDKGDSLNLIEEYVFLSNEEAIDFIREMYASRAKNSKLLLSEILDFKD